MLPDRRQGVALVCWVLTCVLGSSAKGQATLAEINDRTLPDKVADLVWDAIFTKCGNLYYYTEYRAEDITNAPEALTLVEYTDPRRLPAETAKLSPADQANGFQYQGVSTIVATLWRSRSNSPKNYNWSQFYDKPQFRIRITERSGKWKIEEASGGLGLWHEAGGTWLDFNPSRYSHKVSCAAASSASPLVAWPYSTAADLAEQRFKERQDDLKRQQENSGQPPKNSPQPQNAPAPVQRTEANVGQFMCPGAVLRDRNQKDYNVDRPRKILRVGNLGDAVLVDLSDDTKTGRYVAERYTIIKGRAQDSCAAR